MASKTPPKKTLTPEQKKKEAKKKATQRTEKNLGKLYGNEGANAGNALINKFLPGESPLGRVSTDVPGAEQIGQRNQALLSATGTSAGEKESLANMQAGLGGYTSPQYQAQREQQQRGLNSNLQTGMSQLAKAQARGKVYGAAGVAQQQNLLASTQNQKDQLEQDLNIKNIDEMRSRNTEYGLAAGAQNQAQFDRQAGATKNFNQSTMDLGDKTLDREKFNVAQGDTEIATKIGLYTGAGGTALQKAKDKANQKIMQKGIKGLA